VRFSFLTTNDSWFSDSGEVETPGRRIGNYRLGTGNRLTCGWGFARRLENPSDGLILKHSLQMGDAVSPYLAFPGVAEVKLKGRRGLVAAWVGGVEVYPSQRTGRGKRSY